MSDYRFSSQMKDLKPSAIREILKYASVPGIISFAAGNPSAEAFPCEEIACYAADILKNEPITALQYSVTEGYPPLLEALRGFASSRYGCLGEDDELITVTGAQQGMDLACRVFCNEGDTIICEDPSFIGSLNAFRSEGINLCGIPSDGCGMDISLLEKACETYPRAKLIYLIPNFQNPTGATMPLKRRHEIYDIAKRYGLVIIEDNPYGDLRFSGEDIPSIKSFDTEGIVIYVGSFSKILSPGLRVGFVSANRQIIAKMTVGKQCADVHTTVLSQMLCHRFLTLTDIPVHIEKIRNIYRHLGLDQADRFNRNIFGPFPCPFN